MTNPNFVGWAGCGSLLVCDVCGVCDVACDVCGVCDVACDKCGVTTRDK